MSKWYIMNASSWMRKPNIEKIIIENNDEATIMVVTIGDKKVFVLGASGSYGEIGESPQFVYDTGNGHRKPRYEERIVIQNSITINAKGIVDPGNGIGLNEKRSLYVFK